MDRVPLKLLEQCRLPDAGLPADDDQAPVAAPGFGRAGGQQGQRRTPLQQFHVYSVGSFRSMRHVGHLAAAMPR